MKILCGTVFSRVANPAISLRSAVLSVHMPGGFLCEFVALCAMCLCAVHLLGSDSTGKVIHDPAPQIFFSGDRLQMIGIYAAVNTAQVINVESFGNLSDELAVSDPMRQLWNAYAATDYRKPRVSRFVHASGPEPASAIWLGRDKFQDAVSQRDWWTSCDWHLSILTQLRNGVTV